MALVVKNLPANAGGMSRGFDPWVRKIPWRRHGNPLQYSCLGDSMDRGAWWATVHRVTKGQTRLKRLHKHTHTHSKYCLKRIFCGSLEFLCVSLGMPFRPFLKTEFTWATSRDKSMSHQDTGLFTVAIKAKDLLSSVFLSCKANPLHVPHPSVFIVTPVWSLGAKETLAIMLKLNLLLAPWVIKSVVSGVPYLLPLLRQKQHIHCKQGKIKSQFLQVCITSVTAN